MRSSVGQLQYTTVLLEKTILVICVALPYKIQRWTRSSVLLSHYILPLYFYIYFRLLILELWKNSRNLRLISPRGPDGIHPLLLKECAPVLAEQLSLIYQQSYETGTLQMDWKSSQYTTNIQGGSKK